MAEQSIVVTREIVLDRPVNDNAYANETRIGIKFFPDKPLPYDSWASRGAFYQHIHAAINWVIGDWINYGEHAYGEKYAQAVEEFPLEPETLKNICWVCARIPIERRRVDLSFSHHQEVAQIENAEQQTQLLEQAAEERWTTKELRNAVSALRVQNGQKALPSPKMAEFAALWDSFGVPKPALPADPCIIPVGKKLQELSEQIEALKKQTLPEDHKAVPTGLMHKLINGCKDAPFSDCETCADAAKCAELRKKDTK